MRSGRFATLLAAVSVAVGCSPAPGPQPTTTAPDASTPDITWVKYQGDGFSVSVPDGCNFSLFSDKELRNPAASGKPNVQKVWTGTGSRSPSGTVYAVNALSVDPFFAADLKQDKAAAWAKQLKGWAWSVHVAGGKVELDAVTDYPVVGGEGKQATFRGGTGRGVVRVIVIGERVFVQAAENEVMTGPDHPTVKTFLDSFTVQ